MRCGRCGGGGEWRRGGSGGGEVVAEGLVVVAEGWWWRRGGGGRGEVVAEGRGGGGGVCCFLPVDVTVVVPLWCHGGGDVTSNWRHARSIHLKQKSSFTQLLNLFHMFLLLPCLILSPPGEDG